MGAARQKPMAMQIVVLAMRSLVLKYDIATMYRMYVIIHAKAKGYNR